MKDEDLILMSIDDYTTFCFDSVLRVALEGARDEDEMLRGLKCIRRLQMGDPNFLDPENAELMHVLALRAKVPCAMASGLIFDTRDVAFEILWYMTLTPEQVERFVPPAELVDVLVKNGDRQSLLMLSRFAKQHAALLFRHPGVWDWVRGMALAETRGSACKQYESHIAVGMMLEFSRDQELPRELLHAGVYDVITELRRDKKYHSAAHWDAMDRIDWNVTCYGLKICAREFCSRFRCRRAPEQVTQAAQPLLVDEKV